MAPPVLRDGAMARARAIRFLALDVDGVLSDGRIFVGPAGEEWKAFHSRDGLGIRIAQEAGIAVGLISGRRAPAVERRGMELKLEEVHQGVADKLRVFEALAQRRRLAHHEIAFVGDDLVDLAVIRSAGFSAAVPEAVLEVKAEVDLVTAAAGGLGAVREVIEFILRAQGRWDDAVAAYTGARTGERNGERR